MRAKDEIRWSGIAASLVLASCAALAGIGAKALFDRPVRNLHLEGAFERVPPVEVQAALSPGLRRSFLSLNIVELQARVEAMAWVKSAQISRRWPDTLVIQVVEHKAAARWGDTGLLNYDGEIFASDARRVLPELPRLAGPPNTERQVAQRYLELREPLGAANLALAAPDHRRTRFLEHRVAGRADHPRRPPRRGATAGTLLSAGRPPCSAANSNGSATWTCVTRTDSRWAGGPAPTSGSAAATGGE